MSARHTRRAAFVTPPSPFFLSQGTPCGALTIPVFMRTLRKLLPAKSEHAMTRLKRVLQFEQQHLKQRMVLYGALLREDEDGNQTRFCETLREQHLTEIIAYSKHLVDCVHQVDARDGDKGELSIAQLREAILLSDPEKGRPEQNIYLARGIGLHGDIQAMLDKEREAGGGAQNGRAETFSVKAFVVHVQKGLLKKTTPVKGAMT